LITKKLVTKNFDKDFTNAVLSEIKGSVVRTLDLGHQRAGFYQSQSRAVYWDGRNAVGEKVASGVYFYTFTADNFSAARKMLIMK
jgi:flagellar hook assembly protein FlgD